MSAPESVFHHYNSCFDAKATMRRHADPNAKAHPDLATNFLGVRIPAEVFPNVLMDARGSVEPIPIPANWHADIAEWAGALRAIDLAGDRFHMLELGCGWGCWMANTGVAARRSGRRVRVTGIEGDAGHIDMAHKVMAANNLDGDKSKLITGVAAPVSGTALFPVLDDPSGQWGAAPILAPTEAQIAELTEAGSHVALDAFTLSDLADGASFDLLHIDIQGGEADFVEANFSQISDCVRYIVIGTHSRVIEGQLMDFLLTAGWRLEIERPCIIGLEADMPIIKVDGVQGWRAPD